MANQSGGTVTWDLDVDNKKLKSGLSTARTEVGETAKDVEKTFGSMAKKVGKIGLGIGAAFGGVAVAGIGFAIKEAKGFETQMTNVATLISGDSTDAINELKGGILDMAKSMPKSVEELGGSAYDILSAGISGSANQMGVLKSSAILATAGLGDTAGATDLMTSAINAFGLPAENAANISDVLFKTVKFGKTTVDQMSQAFGATAPTVAAAGISLEDFSAATAALTTTGLPASQSQNALRASVIALTKPTADMAGLFAKIGTKGLPDMIESGMTMGDIFMALNDAADGNAEVLTAAFGSVEAYSAAIGVGGAVNEAYTSTLLEMQEGTNAVDEAFQKQTATVDSSIKILKNNISAILIKIGDKFLPILATATTWLAQRLGPAIDTVSNFLKPLITTVAMFVKGVVFAIKSGDFMNDMLFEVSQTLGIGREQFRAITTFAEKFTKKVKSLIGSMGGLKDIANAVRFVFSTVTDAFVTNKDLTMELWEVFDNLFEKLGFGEEVGERLATKFAKITDVARRVLIPMLQFFRAQVLHLWETIKDRFTPIIENVIQNILPKLKETFQDLKPILKFLGIVIGGVLVAAIEGLILAFGVAVNFLSAIVGPALDVITNTIGLVVDIVGVVVKLLTGDWRGAWESAVEVLRGAWNTIKSILNLMLAPIKGILNAIGGVASSVGAAFKAIPGFANGTSFAPGGLALVGERGPELVNLPRGSQVIPNDELSMGGGGQQLVINFNGGQNFRDAAQEREIIRRVINAVGRSDELSELGAR